MERKRPEASLKHVIQVAACCLGFGWVAYLGVLALLYFVIAPVFIMEAPPGALNDDEQTVVLAKAALRHSRENPDFFAVETAANGRTVTREAGAQNSALVDFRSVKADLREIRVTLRGQADGRVKCRVIPF